MKYNCFSDSIMIFTALKYIITIYIILLPLKCLSQTITIIDFSKPSSQVRLFVYIDGRLVASSKVAHGRNSGKLNATKFSNIPGSYKSSIGLMRTAETYHGKHGYSLRVDGLESRNSNVRRRAIVFHPAGYITGKNTGRSLGCFSLPNNKSRQIIDIIKHGTLIYVRK